jgi:hypothetical protein
MTRRARVLDISDNQRHKSDGGIQCKSSSSFHFFCEKESKFTCLQVRSQSAPVAKEVLCGRAASLQGAHCRELPNWRAHCLARLLYCNARALLRPCL